MVNINNVYQKVLAIANKEQRGYITPQEFNLMADKAQNEIYSSYFHNYKTAFFKPKSETESLDDLEMTQQKLDFVRAQSVKSCKVITTTDNRNIVTFSMPNARKIASVFLSSTHSTYASSFGVCSEFIGTKNPMIEVKRIERNDLLNLLANPLTAPTTSRPIFVSRSSGSTHAANTYEIYPSATYTGPTLESAVAPNEVAIANNDPTGVWLEGLDIPTYVQANPIDGIGGDHNINSSGVGCISPGIREIKGASILIDYWKALTAPSWGYVVVRQKALYNDSNTVHFSLHPAEEEPLVMRILELSGVIIEKPQLTKMMMMDNQKTKQEQND